MDTERGNECSKIGIIPCRKLLVGLFLLLSALSPVFLFAQKKPEVLIEGISESYERKLIRKEVRSAPDSSGIATLSLRWYDRFEYKGRLEFTLTNYVLSPSQIQLNFHEGPLYSYGEVALNGLNPDVWHRAGFDRIAKKKPAFSWSDFNQRLEFVVKRFQNEGYPFAQFDLEALNYEKQDSNSLSVDLEYRFDAGPMVKIDSFIIEGNHREREPFIYNMAKVAPGDFYNHKRISDIPRVLGNSIYYEEVQAPEVHFKPDNTATLRLKIKRKQAGKFDLLVGILPPRNDTEKLQVIGSADILMVSLLRLGEQLKIVYNKLPGTSQQLNFGLMVPYLLRTPTRIEGDFELFKQENDFLNLDLRASGYYEFSPFLSTRISYRFRDSRILNDLPVDSTSLPEQFNGRRSLLGLGFIYEKLDYKFNPSKGLSIVIDGGLGKKNLRPDGRSSISDSLVLSQPAQELSFHLRWYIPLARRHVLYLANRSYWLLQKQYLRNDQLLVGGARSIRGFNETEFFTDQYTFFSFEYHLVLERNSYIFAFADQAWLRDRVAQEEFMATGLGIGMNYGTKAGVISLVYAVGSAKGIPFQPARGKIHIGFINQF